MVRMTGFAPALLTERVSKTRMSAVPSHAYGESAGIPTRNLIIRSDLLFAVELQIHKGRLWIHLFPESIMQVRPVVQTPSLAR